MANIAGKRLISHDEYLKGLGLYIMAQKLAHDAERFRKVLEEHLGLKDQSRICDGIYCEEDFDTALGYCDLAVDRATLPNGGC